MILTLETLFKEQRIMNAIIDRTMQASQDKINWKRYLKPHESKSMTFATYLGTTTQVAVGSMIDSHSKKPLRTRPGLRKGSGTLGTFGDSFQIDEARLDLLLEVVNKYNEMKTPADKSAVIEDIVSFLMDDYREIVLAPMMAIDKMIGDARSRGVYKVNLVDGDYEDVTLPINKKVATSAELGSFLSFYREFLESEANAGRMYKAAQMTSATFHSKIVKSKEFKDTFTLKMGSVDVNPANIVTLEMANRLITASGIDVPLELVNERVTLGDGSTYKAFADNAICMLPQDDLGTLEFYKSIEWSDPRPNKNYTQTEGGAVLIASRRDDEGRYLEYQMNAAPNLTLPHKMSIIDVSAALPNG